MATRERFLKQLWKDVIDVHLDEAGFQRQIDEAKRNPDEPFAEVGPALQRALAAGTSPRDLALIARQAAYEAVFQTLYRLGDPGVDDNDIEMLHEELLGADPSGTEGRRAPRKRA
jgi:hypothetical protein